MIVAIEQHIQALAQGEQEQLRGYLRTTVPAAHLETVTEQVRAFVLGMTDDLRLVCA